MIFMVAQKLSGIAVADLGEGPVRPAPPYFEPKQTEARRAQKILVPAFHHAPPPPPPNPLSEGLAPPLYSINIVLKTST